MFRTPILGSSSGTWIANYTNYKSTIMVHFKSLSEKYFVYSFFKQLCICKIGNVIPIRYGMLNILLLKNCTFKNLNYVVHFQNQQKLLVPTVIYSCEINALFREKNTVE
jgi:hypothetical protein